MTNFAVLRDNQIVKHIVMVGENTNYKTPVIQDLIFDNEKKAIEIANTLSGENKVVVYEEEMKKAA